MTASVSGTIGPRRWSAGKRIEERSGMKATADLVRRGADRDVGLARPRPARLVAPWSGRVNEQQFVTGDDDLGDLDRLAVGQRLHEDIDQLQLLVVVEHVGQAVRSEPDATREHAVLGIGDEIDQRMEDRGAGMA